METPGIYRKKVIDFLDRMPVGSVYIIDHICKTENKEMFIEIVKEYIISTRRAVTGSNSPATIPGSARWMSPDYRNCTELFL